MITVFAVNAVQGNGETKMTKFEEEFKALTSWEWINIDVIQQILKRFGNWHSEEEFQELLDKYSSLNDNYEKEVIKSSKLESQIIDLKSQLQQQALPVVPEFVAEWIEILKTKGLKPLKNPETYGETGFTEEKLQNIVFWIFEHQEDYMRAWLDGYTVEKPQQKRYEVKLLSGESMHFNPIGNPKNIKDYRFSFGNYAGWKTQFTKSELVEIKDGMFLKRIPGGTPLDDLSKDKSYYVWLDDCNYWKNPLIELVPVEDGE